MVWQHVVVMEFGKRHDTADTTDFCLSQLVSDLLRTCYGEVANLLRTCYGEIGVMDLGVYASGPAAIAAAAVTANHCNIGLFAGRHWTNRCKIRSALQQCNWQVIHVQTYSLLMPKSSALLLNSQKCSLNGVTLHSGASNPPLWVGDQPPHLTR